ncbi:hypothetical protein FLPS103535_03370 [Flavobacterium psychrophilum]
MVALPGPALLAVNVNVTSQPICGDILLTVFVTAKSVFIIPSIISINTPESSPGSPASAITTLNVYVPPGVNPVIVLLINFVKPLNTT